MAGLHYELSKDLPLVTDADVIVVGGGPGGIGAAVMAARAGARTVLIERYGCLGGMASMGEVHPFMPNHVGDICLDKPIYLEWLDRIHSYYPPRELEAGESAGESKAKALRGLSKEAAMLAAEDLCLEAGVELLYHHALSDAVVANGRIEGIVLLSKSQYVGATAKVYVDATGDADLAAWSGCEFGQGGPSGHSQPMTLCFKLSGVDGSRIAWGEKLQELYEQAKADGRIHCPREDVLMFRWLDDDVMHFNTTRVIHRSATDGAQLSDAEQQARSQLREFLAFFREHVPGFENCRLHSVAHHIGVRESRRVKGLAEVTREDYVACRKVPDAIARVRYNIDIHNPDGTGTEHLRLPEGEWYEIPYGSIVPKDVMNLLIAGRPISVDHAVHSSMRVMPPAVSVGQAAGLAAATAAGRSLSPHELDGVEIRRMLVERGANLAEQLQPAR
jgi:hypothetical protein